MTLPPVRRQTVVGGDPATAYDLFVRDIGTWWPVRSFGCFGAGSSVRLDGERFVETGHDGQTATWGTLTAAEPPRRVAFTWHPGRDEAEACDVTVTFVPVGDATLVTLEHVGWEVYPDPTAARTRHLDGWGTVLDRYADAAPTGGDGGPLWFVLQHTAGPATGPEGVFASPDFPKHVQFLRGLHAAGTLVAAGPLPDEVGAGMTVVRVPDVEAARRTVRAAQTEDGAVLAGLLDVRVRPWAVVMSA